MSIVAFHESVAFSTIHARLWMVASTGLYLASIKPPAQTPRKSAGRTCLVAMASAIASKGGRRGNVT
ncbi:hypothetical protein D1872_321430 [compost metagenome]